MALQLLPVALALGAGYLLFGKKASAASPAGGGGGASPYIPPSTPASGGGGGSSSSSSSGDGGLVPGQIDPATNTTYLGPGGGGSYTPLSSYPDTSSGTDVGPAAVAQGANANASWLDNFTTSGPPLVEYGGAWMPPYAGHELGHPPPRGWPVFW
jgi:hypothetical protein